MLDLKMAMVATAEILKISSSQPILKSAMHHALVIQMNFVEDLGVCKYMILESLGRNIILTNWMTWVITNIQKLQQKLQQQKLQLRKTLPKPLVNLTILIILVSEKEDFDDEISVFITYIFCDL